MKLILFIIFFSKLSKCFLDYDNIFNCDISHYNNNMADFEMAINNIKIYKID